MAIKTGSNIKPELMAMVQDLRKMRQDANLTQEELARELSISRETVNAIENLRPSAVNSLTIDKAVDWRNYLQKRMTSGQAQQYAGRMVEYLMNMFKGLNAK